MFASAYMGRKRSAQPNDCFCFSDLGPDFSESHRCDALYQGTTLVGP